VRLLSSWLPRFGVLSGIQNNDVIYPVRYMNSLGAIPDPAVIEAMQRFAFCLTNHS
jgi:hypothetical protein